MAKLKVGVCESHPELSPVAGEWDRLCRTVTREAPDIFLLNEMPFGRWIAAGAIFDRGTWKQACAIHEEALSRLVELGAPVVLGSRPREDGGKRVNEAFVWTKGEGVLGVHTKQFFPDEEGYYEARWFEAGERHFRVATAGKIRGGFLICTEVMFNERAREYGRGGAQILWVPRATAKASVPRWTVAMRMAAIVSGCYVLSSNRGGTDSRGQLFGGAGMVVTPDGEVAVQTTESTPVAFYEIDTQAVARAQRDYPCYVRD
jgi:N-carbamoylputrescine amidase